MSPHAIDTCVFNHPMCIPQRLQNISDMSDRKTAARGMGLVAGLLVCGVLTAAPSALAQREINHLLDHLERSGCEFYRNGDWHSAKEAHAHIAKKYGYLVEKGLADTAEDFIQRAASQSSMSGKTYRVRCAGVASLPSAQWFADELLRYRNGQVRD